MWYYHADAKSNGGVTAQKQSRASQLTRCSGWTYAIILMPSLGFWMKMLWWIFRRDSKNVTDPLLALVTVKSATATHEKKMFCLTDLLDTIVTTPIYHLPTSASLVSNMPIIPVQEPSALCAPHSPSGGSFKA